MLIFFSPFTQAIFSQRWRSSPASALPGPPSIHPQHRQQVDHGHILLFLQNTGLASRGPVFCPASYDFYDSLEDFAEMLWQTQLSEQEASCSAFRKMSEAGPDSRRKSAISLRSALQRSRNLKPHGSGKRTHHFGIAKTSILHRALLPMQPAPGKCPISPVLFGGWWRSLPV